MTVVVVADVSFRNGAGAVSHDNGKYLLLPTDNRATARRLAKQWADKRYGPTLIKLDIRSTAMGIDADPDKTHRVIPKKRTVMVQPNPTKYNKSYVVTLTFWPMTPTADPKKFEVPVEAASAPRAIQKAIRDTKAPPGYREHPKTQIRPA